MRFIMSAENYGVARVVGLGNKVDVEESDALEYLGEDPETKAIIVYLESFKRPRRFLEVARKVTRHKPVLLLKGGSTEKGAQAARHSHGSHGRRRPACERGPAPGRGGADVQILGPGSGR
ncbi:MAG: hypothetical protein MZU91_00070 [Desulfosudis oleivorans]|nr:hypothetical protein [Desulfosudis oleivorans]